MTSGMSAHPTEVRAAGVSLGPHPGPGGGGVNGLWGLESLSSKGSKQEGIGQGVGLKASQLAQMP